MLQELIDHARLEYPNEACGIVVGSAVAAEGGRAVRFVPTRNAAASPYRYEIDPQALLRLTMETDDRDEVFWGIVHSHVRTAGPPLADGHRARVLPRGPLHPRVARRRRPRCRRRPGVARAERSRLADRRLARARGGDPGHRMTVHADRRVHAPRARAARPRASSRWWRRRCSAGTRPCSTLIVGAAAHRAAGARRRRDSSAPSCCSAPPSAGLKAASVAAERGDLASMIRGVRLAFLAVAAGAVAAGWLLGHALPFVVALIIAGIDVVETSFLLLVVRRTRDPAADR